MKKSLIYACTPPSPTTLSAAVFVCSSCLIFAVFFSCFCVRRQLQERWGQRGHQLPPSWPCASAEHYALLGYTGGGGAILVVHPVRWAGCMERWVSGGKGGRDRHSDRQARNTYREKRVNRRDERRHLRIR